MRLRLEARSLFGHCCLTGPVAVPWYSSSTAAGALWFGPYFEEACTCTHLCIKEAGVTAMHTLVCLLLEQVNNISVYHRAWYAMVNIGGALGQSLVGVY